MCLVLCLLCFVFLKKEIRKETKIKLYLLNVMYM